MKAAIYARISKEEQSVYSIGEQIKQCQEYCEKEKYELVETYVDDGYSAKNLNRPQMQRMLADLKNKKFGMIVIWKLDRMTRDSLDGLSLVKNVFRPNGVEFASVTEDIDTSTPDGYMMFTIRLSMAQNEREKIAERVTLGQMSRAKSGKRNTSAKPYGYNVMEDLSLTINEDEAEIVRQIFEWYNGGYGRNKIATLLNERGIPAPRGGMWFERIIQNVISNPTYIGAVHWKRKNDPEEKRIIVRDAHEPIISDAVFELAQRVMNRRRENDMNLSSYDFAFSTIVKCGKCGRSYHGKMKFTRQKEKRYTMRHYRCSGKYRQESCDASDIAETKLTKMFLDFLDNFQIEAENVNKPLDSIDVSKEIKKLEKQLKDSAQRRKNYTRAMADGKLSYEDFSELIDEENVKSQKWQEELDKLNEYVPSSKRTRKDVVRTIENLKRNWDRLHEQERKATIQHLFQFLVIRKIDDEWEIAAYKLSEG